MIHIQPTVSALGSRLKTRLVSQSVEHAREKKQHYEYFYSKTLAKSEVFMQPTAIMSTDEEAILELRRRIDLTELAILLAKEELEKIS
jgi:hypothetical protein